ncbi:hypothetical protein R1sor_004006 [Riccia sorocarpa]|uniref:Transposase n=1 Tax=Riccia sorocarpa TaxID=122646 RepID=A0ABD3H9D3_9MARC
MYSRRLRETIQHAGMLRYESPTYPQIFEEHVTSTEDGDFDGLQDEEDAMAVLFTEWFPPEPPTNGCHSDQPTDEDHRGVTTEDEDRRTKRRRAAVARGQQTAYEFSRTLIYPGAKNEYRDSTSCPECQTSRYRMDTQGKTIPRKVLRHFPIIPRLRHMFRCRPLADMMTWHKEHRSDDGFMRLVVDSPVVQHVEQTWPEFRRDPRHLHFGLASDGVSPYGVKSSSHSTWPVVPQTILFLLG